MPEVPLCILLDQNVPIAVSAWLKKRYPHWQVYHVNDVELQGKPDDQIYKWAQKHSAIVVTYDEDFADSRMYSLGKHPGVIRLRVWPTTIEKTIEAITRLLIQVQERDLSESLIIIDNNKIRVRKI